MQIINIIKLKKNILFVFISFFCSINLLGSDEFEVKNIYLELSINNNTDHRKKAIEKSFEIALSRYLKWITIESDTNVSLLTASLNAKDLISGYSIESEKYKKEKYSAFISVNFNKEKLERALQLKKIKFFTKKGPKTLLIPLMEFNNKVILWDDPNPWFDTWYRRPIDANLINFILPTRDVDDLITLSADDAKNLSYYKIKNLAAKYNAEDVLVLIIKLQKHKERYSYQLKVYGGLNQEEVFYLEKENSEEENFNSSLFRIANIFADYYDDRWVKINIEKINSNTEIFAVVKYKKFSDWIKIKNFFLKNDKVSSFTIQNLSNKNALIKLNIESEDLIVQDLMKNNFDVSKNDEKLLINVLGQN